MLTPEERRELERCLKRRERGILTADEVAAQLARIARRGKLDALLAELPFDLAVPLMKCIEAGPKAQAYSPTSLPAVASVDVVVLDSGVAVSRVDEFIRVAAVRSARVEGESAQEIASLWRRLPPDEQARCHIPPYGLRFHSGSGLVCEASICWQCNNIYGQAGGEDLVYEFDAEAPVSVQLLAAVRQAAGERPAA